MLLVMVACVWLGWPSTGWSESTDPPENAKPTAVCRSLMELTQWRHSSGASEVEFQIKAHLVYAGRGWDHFRVQYRGMTRNFRADHSLTNQLFRIRVGTLMSFYGRGHRDENGCTDLVVERFENNLVAPYLKPSPGRLGLGMRGTPLFRFGVAGGRIKEVLKQPNRSFVLAKNDNAEFEVIQEGRNHKLGIVSIGELWWFNGFVRKSLSPNPQRTLHQIDQMHESQMFKQPDRVLQGVSTESEREPSDAGSKEEPTNPAVRFNGIVAFSDGERNLGVISGNRRFRLRTTFAHQLNAGISISGLAKPAEHGRLDVTCYDAKFTEVHSLKTEILPVPVRLERLADLKHLLPLPPQVQVSATVEHCIFHDSTVDLHLESADDDIVVTIPIGNGNPAIPFAKLVEGTKVECCGMPMSHSLEPVDPNFPRRSPWRIYVASSKDIKVINRPVTLSTNRLFAGGLLLALAMLCGGFWINRLRRRVKDGDRSLNEIDHHFQSAFGAMQCGILIVDQESRILRTNNRLSFFFGVEPKVKSRFGQYISYMDDSIEPPSSMSDLIDASMRSPDRALSAEVSMSDLRRTMRVFTCPVEMDVRNGQSRLWLFEDVSEKRQLESELVQSQKMDAVGRLSGGIAHDFNNLLMVIRSSLERIRESNGISSEDHDLHDHAGLKSAELAVKRASELTQQLLGFARSQRLEKRRTNAISLVEDVEALASHMVKAPQNFVVDKQCENIMLDVDPGRIEQALFNLCINAIDATKADGGCVTLRISTCNDPNLGQCAEFSIMDNGPGIPSVDQQSIYDPFFTTKPLGLGTGLGLSVALGIIEQHGGRIDCQSTCERTAQQPNAPERGTRFDIILPAISQDGLIKDQLDGGLPSELPSESFGKESKLEVNASGESLSVLVVEDEPSVRVASCAMLEQIGHRVTSVENAMMAIERIAYERPDLVLLDLVLPEMSGVEAYHEIRSAWPDLPILFCSGHIDAASIIKQGCCPDKPLLLAKPFNRSTLESRLDSLIHADVASADETPITAN